MTTNHCLILAGGLGTRLRSEIADLPKCLAPVRGSPFLYWQLKNLSKRGVDNFIISICYQADLIREAIKEPWAECFSIQIIEEPFQLGTGGASKFAMNKLGCDEIIVVNGDTFLGGCLSPLFNRLEVEKGELLRLGIVSVQNRARFGGVNLNVDGKILSFTEKGVNGGGFINCGHYRIHRSAFELINLDSFSMELDILPILLEKELVKSCQINGRFIDIGIPKDYREFKLNISYM
jgi:D-glycero-alpha-D-manno-heptose 1-phosphate guanylyltransferase